MAVRCDTGLADKNVASVNIRVRNGRRGAAIFCLRLGALVNHLALKDAASAAPINVAIEQTLLYPFILVLLMMQKVV